MARGHTPSKSVPLCFISHTYILRIQIIARIQTPSANIRRNINNLLTEVGKHHPQALIYPLTVASVSNSIPRRTAAQTIMDRMREHSPAIVEQVSTLMTHAAIFLNSQWVRLVSSVRS